MHKVDLKIPHRVFDINTSALDNDTTLIQQQKKGLPKLISPGELSLLLSCRSFAPIENHAERYVRRQKASHLGSRNGLRGKMGRALLKGMAEYGIELPVSKKEIAPVYKQLTEWAEEGLLISDAELRGEVEAHAHQQRSAHPADGYITRIGIPTCGRPATLRRCLESFTGNFNRHDRSPDILILDDSRDEDAEEKNRAVVGKIDNSYHGDCYYMNRRQRNDFARAVAQKTGVDPRLMEFALMGHTGCHRSEGGCRNAFLLLSRGHLALQTDDDTICRTGHPPTVSGDLTLTSQRTSDEYWFFNSFEEAAGATEFSDIDFLSIHEKMVGKNPAELIISCLENERKLNVDRIQASFIRNMEKDHPTVRMSLVGPAGDTCLYTDLYRLFLEGDSFRRLTRSADEYGARLSTRHVIRSVTGPTVSDAPRCIGMNFAVDNRRLLPPFMPVQARCDGIFGELLDACFPGAFAGNLPYVLAHHPPEDRPRTAQDLFAMQKQVRVNDMVAELIHAWQSWPGSDDPEINLRSLGQFMKNLGNYSSADFEYRMRSIYAGGIRRRIQFIRQLLDRYPNRPEYWKNHLHKFVEISEQSLLEADFLRPADMDSDNRNDFKNIIHLFGELLTHWPDIYKAMDDFSGGEMLEHLTLSAVKDHRSV